MQAKYIISPVTFYDADLELFYTHIVNNDEDKRFYATVYGSTKQESRSEAKRLVYLLS
jgi:hypothetical protein